MQKIKMLSTLLKDRRPYLKVEYGFQNSKEGLSAGYNIGIRISFRSYEDRDYFDGKSSEPGMSISAYENFKKSLKPYLDLSNKLFSFDFASNEKGNGNVPGKGYRLDHWVLFKFRNTITEAEKQKVINRFLELKNS
ncbi:Dabb family protein [Chryseobacterium sp. 1B4]